MKFLAGKILLPRLCGKRVARTTRSYFPQGTSTWLSMLAQCRLCALERPFGANPNQVPRRFGKLTANYERSMVGKTRKSRKSCENGTGACQKGTHPRD